MSRIGFVLSSFICVKIEIQLSSIQMEKKFDAKCTLKMIICSVRFIKFCSLLWTMDHPSMINSKMAHS